HLTYIVCHHYIFLSYIRPFLISSLFPYTTLFRSVVLDGGGLVAGHNLDAELLVLLSDFLGDVLILIWKDAVHELHDGDVHAVVSKNISKFHADGASANNHHGIRCFFF